MPIVAAFVTYIGGAIEVEDVHIHHVSIGIE